MLALAHTVLIGLANLVAPVAGGSATAAAIVLFTILVRLLISPLSWAQRRGQQRQAALAPKLRELPARHRGDPAGLATEMVALYREAGTTPLSGCLAGLAQAPCFFLMYRLFTTPNDLLAQRLVGVPLGLHVAGASGGALAVFVILFAALAVVAWFASRRMSGAHRVLRLLPFAVVVAAAALPLAADLYLLTTRTWTVLEQEVLSRMRA